MAVLSPGPVQDDELIGSWFEVKLDNGVTGMFSDVSGLAIEVQVVEQTLSAQDTATRKRPGTTKYQEITLKRTLSPDKKFWEWAKSIRDGKADFRTNGAVMLYDIAGTIIGNWRFENAWPSKWSASDLSVDTDDLMQEEVTLQVELLTREQ
ncbi:MAG: phage tail protein [Ilumatobacter fluminis]|uniref:phage tail protein n=1 Tax=Ilumatobacter fluminis TaxID=467091 RepID=UPI0032EF21F5